MSYDVTEPPYWDPTRYIVVFDDFDGGNNASGRVGELDWFTRTIAGGAGAVNLGSQTEANINGAKGISTAATNGDAFAIERFVYPLSGFPQGSSMTIRVRGVQNTVMRWWIGLTSDRAAVPAAAAALEFLGFRMDTGVAANVQGVVKSGAAAETLVDTGATLATGSWTTFRVAHTAAGIEFWTRSGTAAFSLAGTAATTNLLTVGTGHQLNLGVETLENVAKRFNVDYVHLVIPVTR